MIFVTRTQSAAIPAPMHTSVAKPNNEVVKIELMSVERKDASGLLELSLVFEVPLAVVVRLVDPLFPSGVDPDTFDVEVAIGAMLVVPRTRVTVGAGA